MKASTALTSCGPQALTTLSIACLVGSLLLGFGLAALPGCGIAVSSDGRIMPVTLFDLLGGTALGSPGCENEGEPSNPTLKQMFDNLNAYRTANGLPTLRYSRSLEAAADAHAKDMYDRGFFDHTNPDGDGPFDRVRAQGYCIGSVSENLAMTGTGDPMGAHVGWQRSPGHDANMRSDLWRYVGMGHYQTPGTTSNVTHYGLEEAIGKMFLTPAYSEVSPDAVRGDAAATPVLHYWVQVFGG